MTGDEVRAMLDVEEIPDEDKILYWMVRAKEAEYDAARYRWIRLNSYVEVYCDSPRADGFTAEEGAANLDRAVDNAIFRASNEAAALRKRPIPELTPEQKAFHGGTGTGFAIADVHQQMEGE